MKYYDKFAASLIIPTYNKASRLRVVLQSIRNLSVTQPVELLLVDDGSTDDTHSVLSDFFISFSHEMIRLKIITTNNRGRAAARNSGILEAKGDLLIFTDDDLILRHDFVQQHLSAHTKDNLVVHGKIYSLPYVKFFGDPVKAVIRGNSKTPGSLKQAKICLDEISHKDYSSLERYKKLSKFEKDLYELYEGTQASDTRFRWVGCVGGNASISRKNVLEAGLFQQKFGTVWGCEDLELGYRLSKRGVEFRYCDSALNYHMDHFRPEREESHRQAFRQFRELHPTIEIDMLWSYFEGRYRTLMDWKGAVEMKEVGDKWNK